MRWQRANLVEKQEPRAATSGRAKRHAEELWHGLTRKLLTQAAIEKNFKIFIEFNEKRKSILRSFVREFVKRDLAFRIFQSIVFRFTDKLEYYLWVYVQNEKKSGQFVDGTEWIWHILNASLLRVARYVRAERFRYIEQTTKATHAEEFQNLISELTSDLIVRNGVFAGLKYPRVESVGSTIYPKLIGSYENELSGVISECISAGLENVINIGCAEGYYAVGMARKCPEAKIYAYDTNERARAVCRQMAEVNGVSERVSIQPALNDLTSREIDFERRGLVICDCEGCETDIFTPIILSKLSCYKLIVEVHDFLDVTTSHKIREKFAGTHLIEEIISLDSEEKTRSLRIDELRIFRVDLVKIAMNERRPCRMKWFYMKPLLDRA